jgi:hypothetical protein
MTRLIDIGEADLPHGERLFVRTVTQYPPRSITVWQLVRATLELFAFCFCLGAVVTLIVAVAP